MIVREAKYFYKLIPNNPVITSNWFLILAIPIYLNVGRRLIILLEICCGFSLKIGWQWLRILRIYMCCEFSIFKCVEFSYIHIKQNAQFKFLNKNVHFLYIWHICRIYPYTLFKTLTKARTCDLNKVALCGEKSRKIGKTKKNLKKSNKKLICCFKDFNFMEIQSHLIMSN